MNGRIAIATAPASAIGAEAAALRESVLQVCPRVGRELAPLALEPEAPERVRAFWETFGWTDTLDERCWLARPEVTPRARAGAETAQRDKEKRGPGPARAATDERSAGGCRLGRPRVHDHGRGRRLGRSPDHGRECEHDGSERGGVAGRKTRPRTNHVATGRVSVHTARTDPRRGSDRTRRTGVGVCPAAPGDDEGSWSPMPRRTCSGCGRCWATAMPPPGTGWPACRESGVNASCRASTPRSSASTRACPG